MNREIKFRVWDREFQEFTPNDYFLHSNGSLWFNDAGRIGSLEQETFIVQQFTGLKDKNGIEIYEGDIVESAGSAIGKVEWSKNGAEWRHVGRRVDRALYYIALTSTCQPCAYVVGNICENPDLLESNRIDRIAATFQKVMQRNDLGLVIRDET